TSGGTGKTKRLAHTSRVTVQGCNATGKKTHGPVYEGTARVVQGPERDEVHAKIVAKYGFLTRIAQLLGTLTFKLQRKNLSYADSAVVLTVPDAAS
ncbi:MAG: hypothetical protein J2O48_04860, partial [Solirubrobacterales bacterium]|nr:hypothetical protein [Solirubrobacterales bacterium]